MGQILELSGDIINKIAAGEVVERPSSVIKELIENSIDAKATEIHIELVDAGKKKIIVKDNGKGMEEDDIEVSIRRHATSKIKTSEDLFSISTLGFRGEALPAIASVSKLSIISKNNSSDYGIKLLTEYGDIINRNKTAISEGTTIIVEDIYSNTPARLKFLKKNQTELSHCISIINNYALIYSKVAFKLIHNGRSLFFYPSTIKHEDRLNNIYAGNFKWLSSDSSYQYVQGQVYITEPNQKNSKKEIKIFVNGRAVNDRAIYHAIISSFEQYSIGSMDSMVLLFLNIEPEFIDVNVSPTKNEVRFREQNIVYTFVQNVMEQALSTKQNINTSYNQKQQYPFSTSKEKISQPSMDLLYEPVLTTNIQTNEQNKTQERIIIGQFNLQYLLLEENNSLIIIDQHAAHERINFEKISSLIKNNPEKQQLLIPEIIDLNIEDSSFFNSIIEEVNTLGFDIEQFKDDDVKSTFIIRSIPEAIYNINIIDFIRNLISNKQTDISRQSIIKNISIIAARMSCHESIRGKRKLVDSEINELLNSLENCEYPYTCPHGRPVKIEISLNDIEKLFGRK